MTLFERRETFRPAPGPVSVLTMPPAGPSPIFGFGAPATPEVRYADGISTAIASDAAELGDPSRPVILVADATLTRLGATETIRRRLAHAGARVHVFDAIDGDPYVDAVETVAGMARSAGAGLVVGLGGGSALDVAKLAAAAAGAERPVSDYALAAAQLPETGPPVLALPTTAGTGAEVTFTAVASGPDGEKLWWWGPRLAPRRAVLDPQLTVTLPPHITAWTGLDAFVHAFEASTNRNRSAASELFGHEAMRRIAYWLPTAVAEPDNVQARGQLLWGACLAGLALNLGSTAIAHVISHALGSLSPVHHGLATALGLSAALDWQIEGETLAAVDAPHLAAAHDGAVARAAAACGSERDAFAEWYAAFLSACAVPPRLPEAFAAVSIDEIVDAMCAPANAPMRASTARDVADADLRRFAEHMAALAGPIRV